MSQTAALLKLKTFNLREGGVGASKRAMLLATVLTAAALLTAYLIVQSKMQVRLADFAPFLAIAAGLRLLAMYSRFRQMDTRVAQSAELTTLSVLSLMMCGLISCVGLRLRAPTIDATLARADEFFGWDVSHAVPAFAAHGWLIDGLAFIYNLSGPLVAGSIFITLLLGKTNKAWELLTTAVITMQVTAVISIIFPARGAMAYFDLMYLQGNGLPKGAGVYHLAAFDHLHAGSDPRFGLADMSGLVTFPSFHTVLGLMIAQALAGTRLYLLGIGISAAVIVSTIPIGGHYVTDILAGVLIWLIAATTARHINRPSNISN